MYDIFWLINETRGTCLLQHTTVAKAPKDADAGKT